MWLAVLKDLCNVSSCLDSTITSWTRDGEVAAYRNMLAKVGHTCSEELASSPGFSRLGVSCPDGESLGMRLAKNTHHVLVSFG